MAGLLLRASCRCLVSLGFPGCPFAQRPFCRDSGAGIAAGTPRKRGCAVADEPLRHCGRVPVAPGLLRALLRALSGGTSLPLLSPALSHPRSPPRALSRFSLIPNHFSALVRALSSLLLAPLSFFSSIYSSSLFFFHFFFLSISFVVD